MACRAALLAALPSLCSAISHVRAASARDVGFLDAVTEDALMSELMEGLPGFLGAEGGGCREAEQGSPCYSDVTWLRSKGFQKHPEWYPGYTSRSSFNEVQEMLYRLGKAQCPKPCASKVLNVDDGAEPKHLALSSGCVDAAEGDLCYRTVRWLKRTGLEQHPDWFPALEADSSLATIQAELHRKGKARCPKPCAPVEDWMYRALGAKKSGLRVRVGSEDAANWMWDFPKEEVVPTTAAGKAMMECLRKLLHVTPENYGDLRAECEGLLPETGNEERDALVKESMKFIMWAQHHVDDMRAKQGESDGDASTPADIVDPAARPEMREDECLDAPRNTVCYTAVSYGLSEGIKKHPTMYEGLSEHSSFKKVQEFMWRNNRHGCTKPCPTKQVDITDFQTHPEWLRYKKSAADMSVEEMTRYINGEWDGYVARMFDSNADEPEYVPTTTQPIAVLGNSLPPVNSESQEVQNMGEPGPVAAPPVQNIDELLESEIRPPADEEAANDTEPEKATGDAEVANASTENDSTPLLADVASINISGMSEQATDSVSEALTRKRRIDQYAEALEMANASMDAASVADPESFFKDVVSETFSNDAVADTPTEPVADAPTEPLADAPTEPLADASTQAGSTASEPQPEPRALAVSRAQIVPMAATIAPQQEIRAGSSAAEPQPAAGEKLHPETEEDIEKMFQRRAAGEMKTADPREETEEEMEERIRKSFQAPAGGGKKTREEMEARIRREIMGKKVEDILR